MKDVIRSEKNEAFLQEAGARGYTQYVNRMSADQNASLPGFYLGSVQRKITDRFGIRYFININMFNMDVLSLPRPGDPLSCSVEVQFNRDNDGKEVVDVTIQHRNFDETEGFLHRMWASMNFGYYEKRT